MHYTLNSPSVIKAADSRSVHIPGHSLGEGWTRHIVELTEGDTADNPASTKSPLYGPGFIVYDVAKTGITVREFDDAGPFYDSIVRGSTLATAAVAVLDSEGGIASMGELSSEVKALGMGDFTDTYPKVN